MLRQQALLSGFIALFSALIYFVAGFPSRGTIAAVCVGVSACYFAYYFFFELICKTCYRAAGAALSLLGVAVVTLLLYLTGGICSPFIFLYFCILISEAIHGIESPLTLPASMAGYLLVVAGHYFGVFVYDNPLALKIYSSSPGTFLIAAVTVGHMAVTRRMTRHIVNNLRATLELESVQKDALLRKFSELNSTAQIGVLAHRIAHDLRGPIASISGYIELEMAGEKSPEKREQLKDLEETVAGMAEALHGITRFGKAGGPTSENIPLADFTRDLLAIAAFSPQARGVKFEALFSAGQNVSVNASRADLQQACFNVIKNAVEAVGDNADCKKIEIAVGLEGKDAKIAISDNGPGIPGEVLETIFRKSITTKKDGTGVGLIITRDLLARNDGELKMRARDGGGLTVVITMPAA